MKFKKSDKKRKREKIEEDWDFDFSKYEDEFQQTSTIEKIEDLTIKAKPDFSPIKAMFSPHVEDLHRFADLRVEASRLAIEVAAYTDDTGTLWKFYGVLNELWARIRDLYGKRAITRVEGLFRVLEHNLTNIESNNEKIDFKIHRNLLALRDIIYRAIQMKNLGWAISTQGYTKLAPEQQQIMQ